MERNEYALKGYKIAVCEKYICLLGERMVICDREMHEVCTLPNLKSCVWVDFIDENLLIARNAMRTYKIYDLNERLCVASHTALKSCYETFGLPVFDKKKGIIYDSFYRGQFTRKEVTAFSVDTRTFQHIPFPQEGTIGTASRINKDGHFQALWYTIRMEGGNCVLLPKIATLTDDGFVIKTLQNPPELRICYFTDTFCLTQLNDMMDLNSEARSKLNVPMERQGYFCAAINLEERGKIILAYSDSICAMDLNTNTCLFFQKEDYVSDIKLIGGDLFVGTKEKTIVYRNFAAEVLGES